MSTPASTYPIGTTFYSGGKHKRFCTVTEIYRTFDSSDRLVRVEYGAEHTFLGATIKECSVLHTTIARGNPILPDNSSAN